MAHFVVWKKIPLNSTFSLKKTGPDGTNSSGVITAPDKTSHESFDDAQLRDGFKRKLDKEGTWVCVATTEFLTKDAKTATFEATVPNRHDSTTLSGSSGGLRTDSVVYSISVVDDHGNS